MNLKTIRKSRGLTQKELAEKSKVSFSMISKLESGEKENPSYNTLKNLARALDVTVNELLYDGMNEQERAAASLKLFKEAAQENGLIKTIPTPPQMDHLSTIFKDALINTTNNIMFGEKDGKRYLISKNEGICVEIKEDTELDFTTDILEYISFKAGQLYNSFKKDN